MNMTQNIDEIKEEKQFERMMKIIAGEKPREIKVPKEKDLWNYFDDLDFYNSYQNRVLEDTLVLLSPCERIERNLIIGRDCNQIECIRQNLSNSCIDFLSYNRDNYDVSKMILAEPSMRTSLKKGMEGFDENVQKLKSAGVIE